MKTTIITISLLVATIISAQAATPALKHKAVKAEAPKHNANPAPMHELKVKKGNHSVIDATMWNRF
jgi:hypothetical protein